jgi:hypothetical protein
VHALFVDVLKTETWEVNEEKMENLRWNFTSPSQSGNVAHYLFAIDFFSLLSKGTFFKRGPPDM